MASTNMTNVNIRTDKDVKQAAEKIFEKLGLNMTTAINIFLRQSIRENGIPFNLKLNISNKTTASIVEDTTGRGYSTSDDLSSPLV